MIKKPMLRLTCPQVSSLHTRHKEFVPSVLWWVNYSVGLHVKAWALLLHWEWRRKLKIFLTLGASWETFNSTCRQNFRNGLRRVSAKKLSKTEQENAVKRASKEVHFIILKGEKVDKHPASNNCPPQSSQPAFHHKRSIDYYFFTGL